MLPVKQPHQHPLVVGRDLLSEDGGRAQPGPCSVSGRRYVQSDGRLLAERLREAGCWVRTLADLVPGEASLSRLDDFLV